MTDRNQYRVTLSLPWIVRGVEHAQDAINISVSEVGKRVSAADTEHVSRSKIGVQTLCSEDTDTPIQAVLIVAETALVGLTLDCRVLASSPKDAEAAVLRELGPEFEGIPLVPVESVRQE